MRRWLCLLTLAACGKPFSQMPEPAAEPRFPRTVTGGDIVAITITHTPCFGTCPAYSYTFARGGSATYSPQRFIQDSASHSASLDSATFDSVTQRLQRTGFFAMRSRYAVGMSDLPSTTITAQLADTAKVVTRYGHPADTPLSLPALESFLDSTGARLFGHSPGHP
jgi:hypothetical protein